MVSVVPVYPAAQRDTLVFLGKSYDAPPCSAGFGGERRRGRGGMDLRDRSWRDLCSDLLNARLQN